MNYDILIVNRVNGQNEMQKIYTVSNIIDQMYA